MATDITVYQRELSHKAALKAENQRQIKELGERIDAALDKLNHPELITTKEFVDTAQEYYNMLHRYEVLEANSIYIK